MAKRILLVDDEEVCRRSYGYDLKQAGYEVKTANGTQEAMALLGAEPFDAILSDYAFLPGDGFPHIRDAMKEQGIKIPVVVMSGDIRRAILKTMSERGEIFAAIEKGRPREQLVAVLEAAMAAGWGGDRLSRGEGMQAGQ